jgi:hypothetical protein
VVRHYSDRGAIMSEIRVDYTKSRPSSTFRTRFQIRDRARLAGGNDAIALLANTIATAAALIALILTFVQSGRVSR